MKEQIPLDPASRADDPENEASHRDKTHEVHPDLAYRRLAIVNVAFIGPAGAGDREWFLVDAGVFGTTAMISGAAESRFGKNSRPAAILMTHGHFDHVGGLKELAEKWNAPVLAHTQELPFLNGSTSYPAPDPTVGGGLMAAMSPLYPRGPIDLGRYLQALPEDGSVPGLPGWKWIHTPGHSPGHVSFWREADRTLIVGDAFITTRQESAYAVAVQKPEMHGPPKYYTPDWQNAHLSVERLVALEPDVVVTGHGLAMRGPEMLRALQLLARDFERIAVPEHGRYVHHAH
jgi:glyoxylase-like metal-dependent hydrolase (beta-lactamase superfamily II)